MRWLNLWKPGKRSLALGYAAACIIRGWSDFFWIYSNGSLTIMNGVKKIFFRSCRIVVLALCTLILVSNLGYSEPAVVRPKENIEDCRRAAEQGNPAAQFRLGSAYFSGTGVARDAAEAAKWYRKAAEQGHAEAQCELAFLYQCGDGLPEDAVEAAKWYRKAAEMGNTTAQIRLGIRYMGGSGIYKAGVSKDENEGLKWWKRAADQGDAGVTVLLGQHFLEHDFDEGVKWLRIGAERNDVTAQVFLGDCLLNRKDPFNESKDAVKWFRSAAKKSVGGLTGADGQVLSANHKEAAKWYRKASENNDAKGQKMLGLCYNYGIGFPIDLSQASKWYRKAAVKNNIGAMILLADCYAKGVGVPQDNDEAVKWWSKAAKKGSAADEKDFNHFIGAWNAATKGDDPESEVLLADCYLSGKFVLQDSNESVKWYRKAADQGYAKAQYHLGIFYFQGIGVEANKEEAAKWYRKAADQGYADAQYNLASCYYGGNGVAMNKAEAVKWYRKSADQGVAMSQLSLGLCYAKGIGVIKNEIEGYKWMLLASAQSEGLNYFVSELERNLSPGQRAEGQRLAQEWAAKRENRGTTQNSEHQPADKTIEEQPKLTATGFLITHNGYLVTNHHVVKDCAKVRVQTAAGLLDSVVVRVDAASDLALLKVNGTFDALPVVSSRTARLGAMVATVGFPNIGLQGFEPKLSKGEIASLAGIQDDVRYFQISAPIQPGNSGGALVDSRGNIVGVITSQLSQKAALESSGALAQNVNYAVKSSYLLSFLEAVPEVGTEMLKERTNEQKFEAVVDDVKKATVLIIGY